LRLEKRFFVPPLAPPAVRAVPVDDAPDVELVDMIESRNEASVL
jgi:hypothetical protein